MLVPQAMNAFVSNPRTKAFTLVELLVVIAIIGILASLLLPVLHQGQARAQRIWCESNLKQIGLAYHTFANDHSGKFPIEVSTNEGGSLEYIESGLNMPGWTFFTTFRTFQSLSNELVKTELLVCSTDLSRAAATNYAVLQNSNLSYFVGANGTFDKPGSILAGDRSVVSANNLYRPPTVLQAGPGYLLHWTMELHQYQGNVLFADGHVEDWNNARMANNENAMLDVENLFLPSVVPIATPQYGGNGGGPGGGSGGSGGGGAGGGSGGGAGGYNSATPNGGYSTSSGQSMPSPSAGYSSPAMQPMSAPTADQSSPMPRSSAANNTLSQASTPADLPPPSTNNQGDAEVPTSDVATVVSPDDSDVGMSQEDKHLAKILRHTFEWIYLLLLLLMLLYLTYKIRKWMREREAKQKATQRSRW